MSNEKDFLTFRKRACWYHLILAVVVTIILAMHIHLLGIGAKGDVIGSAIFLLVMWLGLPMLVFIGAALYYSFRSRADRKITLMTTVLILLIISWVVDIPPALFITSSIELVYIIFVSAIAPRALIAMKRQFSN